MTLKNVKYRNLNIEYDIQYDCMKLWKAKLICSKSLVVGAMGQEIELTTKAQEGTF